MLLACSSPSSAYGQDPWRSTWAGAIVTEDSWLSYAGATAAPFGRIHDNGWRIRLVTGHGEFDYCELNGPGRDCLAGEIYRGRASFADILGGYLHRFGPLTVSAYLGFAVVTNDLDENSPQRSDKAAGTDIGPKLALELWYDPGGTTWFSINASGSTAHDTYAATSRTAFRLLPQLSVGTEISLHGNVLDLDDRAGILARLYARSGPFLRYTWGNSEISLSGGISGELNRGATSPYGSLTWATKF